MRRWVSVDVAHYQDITLPPIKVFEIGGVYFVRDGNHRVSVAKAQGAEFIDAEVISLASEIPHHSRHGPGRAAAGRSSTSRRGASSRRRTWTRCARAASIEFTEVGSYDELLDHIREHKWYINLKKTRGDPLRAGRRVLVRHRLLSRRPDHPGGRDCWRGSRRLPRRTCTSTWESTGASWSSGTGPCSRWRRPRRTSPSRTGSAAVRADSLWRRIGRIFRRERVGRLSPRRRSCGTAPPGAGGRAPSGPQAEWRKAIPLPGGPGSPGCSSPPMRGAYWSPPRRR